MILLFATLARADEPADATSTAAAPVAAPPAKVHWIPWATATTLTLVDAGLEWAPGEVARPSLGGGVALLVGPAALRLATPAKEGRASMDETDLTGLSAGFIARLDAPRASLGETMGREYGGYVRLGRKPAGGEESRATLAVGWRQSLGADGPTGVGQVVTTFVAERRILPFAAVTVHVDAAFGNAEAPWRVAAGAGAMVGF